MGLFSRQQQAAFAWQQDGRGVGPGGDVGGDIQVGDCFEIRFVCPDLPGRLITVWYYPVEYDECPGEFAVQRQVEWTIGTDPADPTGSEVWAEAAYDDVTSIVIDSAAEAEVRAREFAEGDLRRECIYEWDGEPFNPRES